MCNLGEGIFQMGVEYGNEQGTILGERRMLTLIQEMMKNGEGNCVSNLTDSIFLKEMYQKYRL